MKVVITGGHLTPALGFIDHLQTHNDEVIFIGRLYSQKKLRQRSQERSEVEKKGVPFFSIRSGQFTKKTLLEKVRATLEFAFGLLQSISILRKEKPDVLVSFGSYVGVPVAAAAKLLGIPCILHEQTTTPGASSIAIARLSEVVALSFPETAQFFSTKTVVTGNILRSDVLVKNTTLPEWIAAPDKPLLYITGGNQGAAAINSLIEHALETLLSDWVVVHQCGNPSQEHNWEQQLTAAAQKLSPKKQKRYVVRPWITEHELSWIYTTATAVVARSGANTVAEILTKKIPAIFIPLPGAHDNEQLRNAQPIAAAGAARVLEQVDATPERLLDQLAELRKKHTEMVRAYDTINNPHHNAEQTLYALTQKVVQQT